jgi:hypothetical protein
LTKDQQQQFLTALAMTGIVSDAAKAAGINRSTAYRYRAQHKSFAEDWDHAKDDAIDRLAGVAIQRAVNGIEEVRYFKGEPIGTVRRYSDQLLMFLLRALSTPCLWAEITARRSKGSR